ncbi:MAG TPA: protein-L-isoaspartate(D-aspartate) O-methyltransferase [Phycisphaerae bacterium]|nr:protein-L-isoaspartate(D-aspartate) O-methyltransferase [Phycisphaerae bacterium]
MSVQSPDQARIRMVAEQIRARGIADPHVLEAMEQVPREKFVPIARQHEAFSDRALPIDCGQTISQPFMVASMTDLLDVQPHHRVLEIGTGSGYQAAILVRLAGHVYTIERLTELQAKARQMLETLGFMNISYRVGDGTLGWPEEAPFDRIMVTAGAPEVPKALAEQLVDGGRLIIPLGGRHEQTLTVVDRRAGRTIEMPRYACRFVQLIGQEAWPEPA